MCARLYKIALHSRGHALHLPFDFRLSVCVCVFVCVCVCVFAFACVFVCVCWAIGHGMYLCCMLYVAYVHVPVCENVYTHMLGFTR